MAPFCLQNFEEHQLIDIGGASDLWLTTTPESTNGALMFTHVSHHCIYCVSIFYWYCFYFIFCLKKVFTYIVNGLQMFVLITFSNTLILKLHVIKCDNVPHIGFSVFNRGSLLWMYSLTVLFITFILLLQNLNVSKHAEVLSS